MTNEVPEGCMPFDLAKAKAGGQLITRNGHPVRIICWDRKDKMSGDFLVGLIQRKDHEDTNLWNQYGKFWNNRAPEFDLFIKPKTKMLWIAVKKIPEHAITLRHHVTQAVEDFKEFDGLVPGIYHFIQIEVPQE